MKWIPWAAAAGLGLWLLSRRAAAVAPVPGRPGAPPPVRPGPAAKPGTGPVGTDPGWIPSVPHSSSAADEMPPWSDVAGAAGTMPSAINPYIDALHKSWSAKRQSLADWYTKPRLREIVRGASDYYQVPAEWLWGILWRESRWRPVGVHQNDARVAKLANSSAYGMAQETRTRFGQEKAALKGRKTSPLHRGVTHQALRAPQWAIWSLAESLRRGADEAGRLLTPDEVAAWWAGRPPSKAVTGEGDFIQEHGPDVHEIDGVGTVPPGTAQPPWLGAG